ncbi:MAG: OB-fold nucleic acid binding domain-containing protein [Thermoplasmatota archaeon]
MQQTKDGLYQCVKDVITKKEYEQEILKRYQSYDELFDINTIALLYIDELGKNNQPLQTISDLTPNSEHVIIGTITSISDIRTFTKKNGKTGRVQNVEIADKTGTCRLVLWDNDITSISDKNITIGSKIKIINGYTKKGYTGLEISLGKWGSLEIEEHNASDQPSIQQNQITGKLLSIESTRAFFKDNGDFGFVTTITIQNQTGNHHITVWDDKVKEIQKFNIGDSILFKNITSKTTNGSTEMHVNGQCIIEKN